LSSIFFFKKIFVFEITEKIMYKCFESSIVLERL